jgi:hypothetical protein
VQVFKQCQQNERRAREKSETRESCSLTVIFAAVITLYGREYALMPNSRAGSPGGNRQGFNPTSAPPGIGRL